MANQVSMMFAPINEVGSALSSGRLAALGVTTTQRVPELPDVPAIAEYVKGYTAASWIGLLAPAATPPAVLQKISTDLRAAFASPNVAKQLKELSLTPIANKPEEARANIVADAKTWRDLARQMNITPQ
jgi:tripartite-type tricarboxylate transporter receptor subunit TctC